MSSQTQPAFGTLRSFFWPVYAFELKKVLPMLLMFFFINFNYTILRDTKDSIIVTAAGAEAIPFLKTYGVVPCAIIFMLLYSKLSNILSKEKLFYTIITPFIVFFALFATVLYPNHEMLHFSSSAGYLKTILPVGMNGLIASYENWTFSVFYIFAELWGSAVLSLMFWGFANDITHVSESKRFYTLFGIGANVAMLFSGPLIKYFSRISAGLPEGVDPWQISLNWLMSMAVIAGLLVIAIYWWINRNVLTDTRFYNPAEEKKMKKEKPKMGIMESFAFLAKSKYILCIAILVIAYGISINLVEVTWKHQVKLANPNPNDYSAFMGDFSFFTGLVTIVMLLIGGAVIRKKGWGFAAMCTPVVIMITAGGFFTFILFRDTLDGVVSFFGVTPLILAVYFGMAQNILSKSTKYSFFDPTKEMSYIPLDQESKVKGKAAIDVVGARLGKAGGSFIQQGLMIFVPLLATGAIVPPIELITPYIAVITIGVLIAWMYAVRSLSKQVAAKTAEMNDVPVQKPVVQETKQIQDKAEPVIG